MGNSQFYDFSFDESDFITVSRFVSASDVYIVVGHGPLHAALSGNALSFYGLIAVAESPII